jgi:hypothetical protein
VLNGRAPEYCFPELGMNRNFARIVLLLTVLNGSQLLAQNACPKDEIFGGYAALIPNGWADLFYKVNTIPNAFDASNTFYLRS